MIDWTTIIITGISLFSVGGAGVFIFYRANKGGAIADAVQKSADAMEKMLTNAEKQQEYFNKIIDGKNSEITFLGDQVDENKKQLSEQGYRLAEFDRKVRGCEKMIAEMKRTLSEVEGIACLDLKCQLRKPKLGTYKHKREA